MLSTEGTSLRCQRILALCHCYTRALSGIPNTQVALVYSFSTSESTLQYQGFYCYRYGWWLQENAYIVALCGPVDSTGWTGQIHLLAGM